MSKLLIGTAIVSLSILAISAWQNQPCDERCRAAKAQEFQRQALECMAQIEPNRPALREATACVQKLNAQILAEIKTSQPKAWALIEAEINKTRH